MRLVAGQSPCTAGSGAEAQPRLGSTHGTPKLRAGRGAARDNRAMNAGYAEQEPGRAEVDRLPGPTLLEFGTPWCGWCRGAQPHIAEALATHPQVRRLKVEDGSGRPLGRSYGVKLWPTLVFLRDGQELARLVRPQQADEIRDALDRIDPAGS